MKRMVFALLFELVFCLWGQAKNYIYNNVNVSEGLSHSIVTSIIEDDYGFIWIGTQDGLNKFNGYDVEQFYPNVAGGRISDSWVTGLYKDSHGDIWIYYRNGYLDRYNLERDSFFHYRPCEKLRNGSLSQCFAGNDNGVESVFFEDSYGHLWIGTQNGLNRFVRKENLFISYQSNTHNHNSLSDNRITAIVEDSIQNLWIGTQNGLNQYNLNSDEFTRFLPGGSNNSLRDTAITDLLVFSEKRLVVGTQHDGISVLSQNEKNNYSSQFIFSEKTYDGVKPIVKEIIDTGSGTIYVSTNQGIFKIKEERGRFQEEPLSNTLGKEATLALEDDNGDLWFSVLGSTLFHLQEETNEIKQFTLGENEPQISYLYQGENGILWIGTIKGGVYFIDLNPKDFHFINEKSKGLKIDFPDVYSIFKNSDGNLFIGTENGLFILNSNTENLIRYRGNNRKVLNQTFAYSSELPFNIIGAINEDSKGNIWLGSYDYKVSKFNPETNKFLNFHYNQLDPQSFRNWSVRDICVAKNGDVYFGGVEGGLCKLNEDGVSFKYFPVVETGNPIGTNDKSINCIFEDKAGMIWIGTMNSGLNMLDPDKETFIHYKGNPESKFSLSSNRINSICEYSMDTTEVLWVGTNRGLNKFNKNTGACKVFNFEDNLVNNVIHAVIEGNDRNLWFSTNNGIVKFDPRKNKTMVYTKEDGLPGNEYNDGSCFKDDSGIIYFGGTKGVVYFDPNMIKESSNNTVSFIDEVYVNHENVKIGVPVENQIVIDKPVVAAEKIFLNHRHKTLSIRFGGINYLASKKIKFKYMLEGFDDDWIVVDNERRFADYTNLPSGDYIFKLVSTNSDGIWSDKVKELGIFKRPSIWEQGWFKMSLFIVLLLLTFWAIRLRTKILRKQKIALEKKVRDRTCELRATNKILEEKQKEITVKSEQLIEQKGELEIQNQELKLQKEEISLISKELHESDQQKLRFFTNVSHEIRTPLTLILAPTEKLLQKDDYTDVSSIKKDISLIYRNEKRLLELVNQVLDLRKIELDPNELLCVSSDFVGFLREVYDSFQPLAKANDVKMHFDSKYEKLILNIDKDKVEKIFINLLSNALKFTESKGEVRLVISQPDENDEEVCVSIIDSGPGISNHILPHIFDRFYQINHNNKTGRLSSGIGLSIVKDLIDRLDWRLSVDSTPGEGTCFNVFVPRFKQEEINLSPAFDNGELTTGMLKNSESERGIGDFEFEKSFSIVLVEDNIDVLDFLANELSVYFKIYTAVNGKEGFALINEVMPDLIISDVMMPEMDGFELCKKVKSDEKTSHIGVFLLTARVENESQVLGLELGADDYIAKPFSIEVIKLRIRNLIKIQEANRKIFNEAKEHIPTNINVRRIDQQFLENLVNVIELNLDDTALSGEFIADKLGLSKSHLYRKIKNLTGVSVNIFIRNTRLKVAAKLLEKGDCSISDVAYSVGFSNPKYFSTCFSEMFSKTPTEYMVDNK